ncbi:NACHT N-terminal helical domain 7-containing protein [Dactylosporangium cerinum]
MDLRSALRALGHADPQRLHLLDQALDGAIAADPPRLGAAVFDVLWAGSRPTAEVVALLHADLDRVPSRLASADTYGRAELVVAAHTALVYAAFFEVADRETKPGRPRPHQPAGVERLLQEDVPAPSAGGFSEHRLRVERWYARLSRDLLGVKDETAARQLSEAALRHYQASYLRLATTVPEFLIWASLGQEAQTRTQDAPDGVGAAMATNTQAMARLEALLRLCAGPLAGPPDLRRVLHRSNAAVLDQAVMHPRSATGPPGLRFPLIRDVYLNPRYRICLAGRAPAPPTRTGGRPGRWRLAWTSASPPTCSLRPPSRGRCCCSATPAQASRCSPRFLLRGCRPTGTPSCVCRCAPCRPTAASSPRSMPH